MTPRRRALSHWRRRRTLGRKLQLAEQATAQPWTHPASLAIDRRLVALERAT